MSDDNALKANPRLASLLAAVEEAGDFLRSLQNRPGPVTAAELPALMAGTTMAIEKIVNSVTDPIALAHLSPEVAAETGTRLIALGESMKREAAECFARVWLEIARNEPAQAAAVN